MSPRSKKLSEQMKAESRSSIVAAALELFAKKGFSATTTDAIAKAAGVSKGLIFVHFPTKQDLLIAIIDEEMERLFPQGEERNDQRTPREKLTSLIDTWIEIIKTEPMLVRLTLQLNLDDAYQKIMRRKGKRYLDVYLRRMRSLFSQLGSKTPDLDCFLLAFFFDGITANYTVAPNLFPIDAIKDHFVNLLLSRWDRRK